MGVRGFPFNINEVLEGSANMFGRTHKEIEIQTRTVPEQLVVEADRRQIEQVFLNIYINAWQAMPDGGALYLETKAIALGRDDCKTHKVNPGRYVQISITDTGIGMDKATCKKIFDPFFTTKEKRRGTGLGLASAYGIVTNHNGFIDVTSTPGEGSTFSIFLPTTEKVPQPKNKKEGQVLLGDETILIVDDEKLVTKVGGMMLNKLGYRVIVANSGPEAVEIYKATKDKIHLVILDMIMPGMSGKETFDKLISIDENIRVLLSSGYSMDGDTGSILQKGAQGFIQKPFTTQELSQKIRESLV